ncbi:MAG: CopG family transcriptional regulator [Thermoplasmata archaeon]|jgi:hypothetical protein
MPEYLTIYMDKNMLEKIKKKAKENDVSISKYVRKAIKEYMEGKND